MVVNYMNRCISMSDAETFRVFETNILEDTIVYMETHVVAQDPENFDKVLSRLRGVVPPNHLVYSFRRLVFDMPPISIFINIKIQEMFFPLEIVGKERAREPARQKWVFAQSTVTLTHAITAN
mmetsp:Transcript_17790/g.37452  ORF Transcript_17790/g.37452 Transcript_17790/m.37452 type:complete len:123 (-) Transcript_17790:563-931(-)